MTGKSLRPLLIIIILLLLLTTFTGCITDLDPRMFHSSNEYDISIRSDGPLSNITIIIPLPVKNNTPMVGPAFLTVGDFQKENVTIDFTQTPLYLNISGSDIQEGYNPWFIIIQSNMMHPSEPGNYVYRVEKKIKRFHDSPAFSVNTLYPIGNESIIVPKQNFSWHEPEVTEVRSDNIRYPQNFQSQKTIIYVNYSAKPGTKVEIWTNIQGSNTWKQGYDDWVGNNYHDNYWRILSGPQSGWITINGEFQSGNGPYPNYDHPEWQKALNQTAEPERRSGMEIYEVILAFFRNKGN